MKRNRWKYGLIGFFLMMILGTIVCRIRDSYVVARVLVSNPTRRELQYEMSGEGYFASTKEEYIQPHTGWKIGQIYVSVGSRVNEGDVLWQYDVAYLTQLYADKQQQLTALEWSEKSADLSAIPEGRISETQTATNNLQTAKEQVAIEKVKLTQVVSMYQKSLQEINERYEEKKRLRKEEYTLLMDAEDVSKNQKKIYENNLEAALTELDESLQQEKQDAYQEVIAQNENLFTALREQQKLEIALTEAAFLDASYNQKQGAMAAITAGNKELLQQEQAEILEEMTALEGMLAGQGYVYASAEETITYMDIATGKIASGEEIVSYCKEVNTFTVSLSQEEAARIEVADTCQITTKGGQNALDGEITNISYMMSEGINESEGVLITCKPVAADAWEDVYIRQPGSFKIKKKSESYANCIPISAILSSGGKLYCMVLANEQTVLGMEYVAEQVEIEILSKDATYAAVSGNLTEVSQVITDYNTLIQKGDRVRVVREL